jgi:hypothetical protein
MIRGPAPLAVVLLLAACGGDSEREVEPAPAPRAEQPRAEQPRAERAVRLDPVRCPADLPECRTASGRILLVERVDPDGDGDAHFVLASPDSITAPGISTIAVERSLRPRPLPGPGDRLSAAGQVFRGHLGQKQIEAVVVHVARPR